MEGLRGGKGSEQTNASTVHSRCTDVRSVVSKQCCCGCVRLLEFCLLWSVSVRCCEWLAGGASSSGVTGGSVEAMNGVEGTAASH